MATRVNAETGKGAIPTRSKSSVLRADAPQLRTTEAILEKNEQVVDALEHGVITPKMAEQMNQCIKTPVMLARLEMTFLKMAAGFGRKIPVPRSPLLRSAIGLTGDLAPTDGEFVRGLLPDQSKK